MNIGAWIMFFVGAIGLWGGLILFILHFFKAAKEESQAGGADSE